MAVIRLKIKTIVRSQEFKKKKKQQVNYLTRGVQRHFGNYIVHIFTYPYKDKINFSSNDIRGNLT